MWMIFKHNLLNLLIAIDQVLNVLIGMFTSEMAYADETISSRSWRWHIEGVRSWPKNIIDTLFFWDKQEILEDDAVFRVHRHCQLAFESERTQRHLPPEARYILDTDKEI